MHSFTRWLVVLIAVAFTVSFWTQVALAGCPQGGSCG